MQVEAESKVLEYTKKNLLKGEKFLLKVNTEKKVKFTSADMKIASVNKNGVVTAKKKGKTTISVKVGQEKEYKCQVMVSDQVDLIIFAGQSNMTGAGGSYTDESKWLAPKVKDGAGYECKTITNPDELVVIEEPFGFGQDTPLMNDSEYRHGTLVPSFVNSYYTQTHVPVVGVSVTAVGTYSKMWKDSFYQEIVRKYEIAMNTLQKKKLKVRKQYLVFLQGESDALEGFTDEQYTKNIKDMFKKVRKQTDIKKCLMIRIGSYLPDKTLFNDIIKAQTNLCKTDSRFVLISTKAASLSKKYYCGDGLHLNQRGLNTIGKEAGKYAGIYATTGTEPSIEDKRYKNTYVPEK